MSTAMLRLSKPHRITHSCMNKSLAIRPRTRSYAQDYSSPPPKSPRKPLEEPVIETFSSKARAPSTLNNYLQSERLTTIPRNIPRRSFATEQLPRPPPPTPGVKTHMVETFESTSRPRPVYGRAPPVFELPLQKKRWPLIAGFIALGLSGWAAFLLIVANQEKLSSSIVRQIMRSVRDNPELRDVLGESIRPQGEWWLNGDPWIEGAINMLNGNIDVSFKLKGHKSSGNLYFTSVRKAKGEPFTILRFRVRADDGTVINIHPSYAS